VLAQYGPVLDEPRLHDPPNDLLVLPESIDALLTLVIGVALVLGRRRIADAFASITGWGSGYRRFCEVSCAIAGATFVVIALAGGVRWLL
jgi:hypothetical protein